MEEKGLKNIGFKGPNYTLDREIESVMVFIKSNTELLGFLERGLQRLKTPAVWIQRYYFEDHDYHPTMMEEKAEHFCVLGACGYVTRTDNQRVYRVAVQEVLQQAILRKYGKLMLPSNFNDDPGRKPEEVIEIVEEAIRMVKDGEYSVEEAVNDVS